MEPTTATALSRGVVIRHANQVYCLGLMSVMTGASYVVRTAPPSQPTLRPEHGCGQWALLVDVDDAPPVMEGWDAVVAIVATCDRANVVKAMAKGATAIVASTASSAAVVAAISAAFDGNAVVPRSLLVDFAGMSQETAPCALNDEEIGYLQRLARGMTVCELARAVGRSERDMYRILSRLWTQMRAIDRTDGLLTAARNGWLDRLPASAACE